MNDSTYLTDPTKGPPLKQLLLLWGLALIIAFIGLGELSLRDFDEGIVARVSYELTQKKGLEILLPTLWDAPYLNKPPGLHWLIAGTIALTKQGATPLSEPPTEFVVRLVPAFLSTLVVPFGGLLQWEIRKGDRVSCLTTSAILLTLLPIARHGRLAMLDGPCLSAIALLWLLIASNKQTPGDRFRLLGLGLTGSCMLMLKAPLIIPASIAAVVPSVWSRELRAWWNWKFSIWLGLGLLPGFAWHIWHGLQRGTQAFWLWGGDGAGRVLFDLGEGSDMGWKVPVIEILEGGWPWLVLWPIGIIWAWKERNNRWGKWALGTQIILVLTILPLKTQLPWYSHPLWLPFSIICSPPLAWLITRENPKGKLGKKLLNQIPFFWIGLGGVLVCLSFLGISGVAQVISPFSKIAFVAGTGWALGGYLLTNPEQEKRQAGAYSLIAGSLCALALLMGSSLWLWELNENWPVKPLAELASKTDNALVFLEGNEERPSLNWYAGKQIKRLGNIENAKWVLTSNPKRVEQMLPSIKCNSIETHEKWALLFCNAKTQ